MQSRTDAQLPEIFVVRKRAATASAHAAVMVDLKVNQVNTATSQNLGGKE